MICFVWHIRQRGDGLGGTRSPDGDGAVLVDRVRAVGDAARLEVTAARGSGIQSWPLSRGYRRGALCRMEAGLAMLGPFLRTPPPGDEKERRVARVVVWAILVLSLLMALLSVVLPPSSTNPPQESVHEEAGAWERGPSLEQEASHR
jgi:hypothetical protein